MDENKNEEQVIEAFGALPETIDIRDYKLRKLSDEEIANFPETFELETVEVKSQGSVGSCVAHAISEVIEYHNKTQDNIKEQVSVGFIYGNRRDTTHKGTGMVIRVALNNIVKYGDVFDYDFPENKEVPKCINLFEQRFNSLKNKAYPNRFSTYFRVKTDDEIKYTLLHYGPVVFGMSWYSDLKVKNGIIKTSQDSKKYSGGHCMIIYGWNKDGWKIQNSWGKLWGKSGRAILPYDIKKTECWGVADNVSGENKDIKRPLINRKTFDWVYKIANWIFNLIKKNKKAQ